MSALGSVVLCIGLLGQAPAQAVETDTITLDWVHSVEKIHWIERWSLKPEGFVPIDAKIKSGGSGMEPPPEATLVDGWYVYTPDIASVPEIVIPDSDFTAPMTLCTTAGACDAVAAWAGRGAGDGTPVRLSVAPTAAACGDAAR